MHAFVEWNKVIVCGHVESTYRDPFTRIHLDHGTKQRLAVRRDERGNVKYAFFDFFQQIPQIVIVKRQSTLNYTHKIRQMTSNRVKANAY